MIIKYAAYVVLLAFMFSIFSSPVFAEDGKPGDGNDVVITTEETSSLSSDKTVLVLAGIGIVTVASTLIIKNYRAKKAREEKEKEGDTDDDFDWFDDESEESGSLLNPSSTTAYTAGNGFRLLVDIKDIGQASWKSDHDFRLENQQLTLGLTYNF